MKLNETDAGGSTSAGSIAGNRGYSIFGQRSKPLQRVVKVPTISFKNDARKLKSYTKSSGKGVSWGFGTFLANNLPNAMGVSENFNLSDALAKISNAAKQSQETSNNTVTFGLEDDKGGIIKVFVDAEQSSEFEEELAKQLEVDMKKVEIAELLFNLRNEFNIVNIVWPKIIDDAVEEEEVSKDSSAENKLSNEFNQSGEGGEQPEGQDGMDPNDPNNQNPEEPGAHDAGENDIDVNALPAQDTAGGSGDNQQTIQSILSMLSADAEAKKADADARAAEARAREAEMMARAAEAKIKSEEQILDMEAYNKRQTTEKGETRKLAKLAKYRHDLKRERFDDALTPDTIELDPNQHKQFEEEEINHTRMDGTKSNRNDSISSDTLMKIARMMQAKENAQE